MLLVDGAPAEQRNQKRIPIRAFVKILINLDIRSITFSRGLGKEELVAIVQAMSMRPETAREKNQKRRRGRRPDPAIPAASECAARNGPIASRHRLPETTETGSTRKSGHRR